VIEYLPHALVVLVTLVAMWAVLPDPEI